MKKVICYIILVIFMATAALAKPPTKSGGVKSKFYDFNEQLIDGEIRRPTNLYVDSRAKVKFDRLLKLKRSFIRELFNTSKLRVFK